MASRVFTSLLVALPLLGCGEPAESPAAATSVPPAPDAGPAGCEAGEAIGVDGSCIAAGIPPEACGPGFEADGTGACTAILPPEPCAAGLMAIPGETACREVAPCGAGAWGDIPVEASTQYVDGAYAAGDSDGSAERPWTTIQQGVDAADLDAIVAIAAGTYVEDVQIDGTAVRLWGKCPAEVEVVATGSEYPAVLVGKFAGGTEIRDLAIRGDAWGLIVSGSKQVVVDRVWVHDTEGIGLDVEDSWGMASFAVTRSLVEAARGMGLFAFGAEASLEASAVRGSRPFADATFGRGAGVEVDPDTGRRARLAITSSVLEHNHDTGVVVAGADLTMDATLVRDTLRSGDGFEGRGIVVQSDSDTAEPATAVIRTSAIELSREVGIFASGADVTVEATVVRDTLQEAGQDFGRGIAVQRDPDVEAQTTLSMRASVIERCHEGGMLVGGADVHLESVVVRDTQGSNEGDSGRGIGLQTWPGIPTTGTIVASVVERNHEGGILVIGSELLVDRTLVEATLVQTSDGSYGDGIAAIAYGQPAIVTVTGSRIGSSARAGISAFGATIELGSTEVACNAIDLDSEPYEGVAATWVDLGDTICTDCGGVSVACQRASMGLSPPVPAPLVP